MTEKILYWIPRILTIFAILFMLMFSFDVFEADVPFGEKIQGFFLHNIPVLVLLFVLLIAWRWEITGGILFIAAFTAGCIFFDSFSGNPASLLVITPFFITGILFILHQLLYVKGAKNKNQT